MKAWILGAVVLAATMTWASDAGNCLLFDGSNDCVTVTNDASLDVGNTLTIEAWVKADDLTTRQGIFSTRLNNEGGSFQLEVGFGSGGTGRVAVAGVSTWIVETGDDAILPGEWTHIAYVRSSVSNQTLYVNGVAQALNQESTTYAFTNNTSDKVIASGTSGSQLFAGQIDELRVWNVARSQAEIRSDMLSILNGDESGLVACYRFDESSGTSLPDETANANDGTLVNMVGDEWTVSGVPIPIDCGDAPAPYPTLIFANNGARHVATGPRLGATRDSEGDGAPSASADGDGADEDGISGWTGVQVGALDASVTVNVQNASSGAYLDAWIDWNGDGNWGGKDERIADSLAVSNGDNTVTFDVPADIVAKDTYARFRLSSAGGLGMGGEAADGEVEDYQVTVTQPTPTMAFAEYRFDLEDADFVVNHIAAADMDNDGDVDFILGDFAAIERMMMKNGGATGFTEISIPNPDAREELYDLEVADINGDGTIDFVEGLRVVGGMTTYYEYDGDETFTRTQIPLTPSHSVAPGDVDNDGDMDIVSGWGAYWVVNDGSENFTGIDLESPDPPNDLALLDWDHDGDLDIVDSRGWLLRNDGSNQFAAEGIFGTDVNRLLPTDLDNDGDYDLIVTYNNYPDPTTLSWLENDGSDSFTKHELSTSLPLTTEFFDPSVADINGDGYLDILTNDIFINDGDKTFSQLTQVESKLVSIAVDLDGNGMLDIVQAGDDGKVYVFLQGTFDCGDAPQANILAMRGAAHGLGGPSLGSAPDLESDTQNSAQADGDDNDGNDDEDGVSNWQNVTVGMQDASVDVTVQNGPGLLNAWIDWNNDGSWGGPLETIALDLPVTNGVNTVVFDIPDFADAGQSMARFRISADGHDGPSWYGGAGEVEDHPVTIASRSTTAVSFSTANALSSTIDFQDSVDIADLDDDGDMDLIGADGDVYWLENDGDGSFTEHAIVVPSFARSASVVDLDGDQDKDILYASSSGVFWLENDGSENFTMRQISADLDTKEKWYPLPFAADIDQDGDLDVFVALDQDSQGYFENDGSENFAFRPLTGNGRSGVIWTVADMDRDGDLDLIGLEKWWENDGSGGFTYHSAGIADLNTYDTQVGDMDGNGTPDIVCAGMGNVSVLFNDGNGNLTATAVGVPSLVDQFDIGDIDGDGDLDIATSTPRPLILVNDGSGSFTSQQLDNELDYFELAMADLDGDGDLDYFGSKYGANYWYEQLNFPVLVTTAPSNITATSAACGGNVSSGNGSAVTARGVVWNTTGSPTIDSYDGITTNGAGLGAFTSALDNLTGQTTYAVRAYATNSAGYTGYGEEFVFTTDGTWTPPGNAFEFDGTNDYAEILHDASLKPTNALAIEAWVYKADWDVAASETIFGCTQSGGYSLTTKDTNPDVIHGYVRLNAGYLEPEVSTTNLAAGWHHLALTCDGRYARLYVDGSLVDTQDAGGNYALEYDENNSLIIGAEAGGGTGAAGDYFTGQLDEVRIWNEARTEAEIQDNMHRELNGDESGLAAYFPFNQSGAAHLDDLTANHNDGAVNGAALLASTIPCADAIADATNLRAAWIGKNNPTHASSILTLTDTHIADADFVVFGHDGGDLDMNGTTKPAGIGSRLGRVWQLEVTGTLTDDLAFDCTSVTGIADTSKLRLLIDDDGDFSDATVVSGSYAANTFTVTGHAYQDGATYTLGEEAQPPTVTTADITGIGTTTATGGGEITEDYGHAITARGVVWNTTGSPIVASNDGITDDSGNPFVSALTGLTARTTYAVRAYATTGFGDTRYGEQVVFTTGDWTPPGNALEFDGSNDYANVGNDASLDVGNTLTVEAWVKADDLSTRQGIFSTRLNNEGGAFQLEVGPASGGTNRVAVSGLTTWVAESGDDAILPGEWTHIAYVRSDVSNQVLYVNGVAQSLVQESTTYAFINNTSDKVIASGTSSNQFFVGRLDELRIWNDARTEDEIRDNMHRALNGDETGLVAYFPMNQSGTTILADVATNANDGALVNMDTPSDWVVSFIPCANAIADATNVRAAWIAKNNPTHASSILTLSDSDIIGADFVAFGHDDGELGLNSSNAPGAVDARLGRIWQLEVSGSLTGDLVFACAPEARLGDPSMLSLLVDADGNFSDATVLAGSYADGAFTVTNQTYQDGDFYTLGQQIIYDYGDAPAPYPTLGVADGARHEDTGPTLGATRDVEGDGAPSANADGDGADEDGISGWTNVQVGRLDASVTVNVQNGPAKLDAWIDWDGDGCWGGGSEHIVQSMNVTNGDHTVALAVPAWAKPSLTYARFRLSSTGNMGPDGPAVDGEVEDCTVTVLPAAASARSFTQHLVSTEANGASSVGAADLDGDGDMDLVGTSREDDEVAWYENDGGDDPSFTRHIITSELDYAGGVWVDDMDGDGDLDLTATGAKNNELAWFENDGAANFTYHSIATNSTIAWDTKTADINADGHMDIVVTEYRNPAEVTWYENDGNSPPAFTRHALGVSKGSMDVVPVDLDGDGDMDIMSSEHYQIGIVWYENDGNANFTRQIIDMKEGVQMPRALTTCDIDGDGDIDFFVVHESVLYSYENDGAADPSFAYKNIGPVDEWSGGEGPDTILPADVDGDGDMDLVSIASAGYVSWVENDGTGDLTIHLLEAIGSRGAGMFPADIDGDGDIDMVASSILDDIVVWFEQARYYDITATAGAHGSIAPSGTVQVVEGRNKHFTITPGSYYHVSDVATNGTSVGAVTEFTWSNVTANGTIHADFVADLAAQGTPHWWLAQCGLTNGGWTFDQAETNNPDSDPLTSREEYIADTSPTDSNDYFRITGISVASPPVITFDSSSNRMYTMYGCSNLVDGVWTNIPGAGPRVGLGSADTMTDTNEPTRGPFYRITVELP